MRSASTITAANSAVVSDISHTQCTAYCIAAGYTAHSHPDHTPTRRPKHRAPISHTSIAVHAESTQLIASTTHAEAAVYTPNTRNTAATSSG